MANHCWNGISISRLNKEKVDKILSWLKSYEDFSYMNDWVESIISEEYRLTKENSDNYVYGGRWFDFGVDEHSDTEIRLSGDSAWSPMLGLCQVLSKEFECKVEIQFEESGADFGGEFHFDNGQQDILYDGSYSGYQYYADGIDRVIENYEWLDDDIAYTDDYKVALADVKEFLTEEDLAKFREAFIFHDKEYKIKKAIDSFTAKLD